jgi:hypothetical protein
MSPAEQNALKDCQGYAAAGRMRLSWHVESESMPDRGATIDDVKEAIRTSTNCKWQPDKNTWRLEGGMDLDDETMTVIAVLDDGVLVVTIF